MKIQKTLVTIVVALAILLTHITAAHAFPPLPCSFFGVIKINGGNVPVGTPVSVWINGARFAAEPAGLYDGDSVYSLIVPGDDPATVQIEGGAAGDTVIFQIGDHKADQSAVWVSGASTELNLTASVTTAPTISLAATFNPFTSTPGVPSSVQQYTVSAWNLTAAVNITAPDDFQISRNRITGFGSSLSLTPVEGSVDSTIIYVRFQRAVSGSSSGNITHTSTGVVSQNVVVSGIAAEERLFLPLVVRRWKP